MRIGDETRQAVLRMAKEHPDLDNGAIAHALELKPVTVASIRGDGPTATAAAKTPRAPGRNGHQRRATSTNRSSRTTSSNDAGLAVLRDLKELRAAGLVDEDLVATDKGRRWTTLLQDLGE